MRKKQVSQKPHFMVKKQLYRHYPLSRCGAPMAASNTTNSLKMGPKHIRYYSCSNTEQVKIWQTV